MKASLQAKQRSGTGTYKNDSVLQYKTMTTILSYCGNILQTVPMINYERRLYFSNLLRPGCFSIDFSRLPFFLLRRAGQLMFHPSEDRDGFRQLIEETFSIIYDLEVLNVFPFLDDLMLGTPGQGIQVF